MTTEATWPGEGPSASARIRTTLTAGLSAADVTAIRDLLWAAFDANGEGFTEDDWQHALGGAHVVAEVSGRIVAHAALVERAICVGDRRLTTGYVEAVATAVDQQGQGFGSVVMREVGARIAHGFELGVLGTGRQTFYARFGWRSWEGPSFVRTAAGDQPTPDDDGYLMVLATPQSPDLDLRAPISCEWRPGDAW